VIFGYFRKNWFIIEMICICVYLGMKDYSVFCINFVSWILLVKVNIFRCLLRTSKLFRVILVDYRRRVTGKVGALWRGSRRFTSLNSHSTFRVRVRTSKTNPRLVGASSFLDKMYHVSLHWLKRWFVPISNFWRCFTFALNSQSCIHHVYIGWPCFHVSKEAFAVEVVS
jgi:hypothetical protein